ncbi:DNA polymerase catalytic subunit [pteropodid alphaherpesvirus 2]|uniref:DNA polymerase n=2 Tax=Simplexvirus TaxID=10294 RepID=A0A510J725_9ALPH|nr:DNA polymerase catalytic subunit [pteropodid alphaherpesvirus 2]BBM13202.1 DNA polymerase catalytic subunit [pteropodid alphaherpesvirus 2]
MASPPQTSPPKGGAHSAARAASSFFHAPGSNPDGPCLQPRRSFFNPFLASGHTGGTPRRQPPPARHTYCSDCSEFTFIAPRALDEDAPAEQRIGVHQGLLRRAPRVYCNGEERDILAFGPESFWPRRARMWGGVDFAPPNFSPNGTTFHVFDIVENVEHAYSLRAEQFHGRFVDSITPAGTVITLLGLTADGHRIAVHVYGIRQYFFMPKADVDRHLRCTTPRDLSERMAAALREAPSSTFRSISADHFEVSVVERADVYFYETRPTQFYKIWARSSRAVSYLCDNFWPQIKKYEGGVDATTRFILDNPGFTTFGWYRLQAGASGPFQLRDPAAFSTASDIEVNCTADNLAADASRQDLPAYKLMCFDIECKAGGADETAFPVASNPEDLVIQISCLFYDVPTSQLEHILLFSLGSCDLPDAYREDLARRNLPEPVVLEFDSEFEMLLAFVTVIKQYGPEFVTGYNIINFDWPFVIAKLTDIYKTPLDGYGRFNSRGMFRVWDIGQSNFQKLSKIKVNGMINIDMYGIVKDKIKLSSYKLNAVAEAVLKDKKKDLSYKDIPKFFASGPDLRGVIAEYCIQDSLLVGQLFFKFYPHLELAAVARLAGISLTRTIYDGQQIRVYTCLLRLAAQKGFLLPDNQGRFRTSAEERPPAPGPQKRARDAEAHPDLEDGEDDSADEAEEAAPCESGPSHGSGRQVGYQGAKVLDPTAGFHVSPVVVFDFASLYPSIIQAHNLCFSTLSLNPEAVKSLEAQKDYLDIEVGGTRLFFVKAHVRESLLSILLRDWLAMRKQIRSRIPLSTPEEAVLLDKQQAAIKVVCNSVYGFTGVQHGLLPCLHVAATVTTIGRNMLLATREYVHTRWTTMSSVVADFPEAAAMGTPEPFSMRIIYGDTDSIFVKCRGLTAEGLTAMGDKMASHISRALFIPPIKLECEKTFTKLLLIAKKKYIGVICGGKMLIKGVDLVRKNNCAFINQTSRALVDLLFYNDAVSQAAAQLATLSPEEWLSRPLPKGLGEFGAVLVDAHRRITDPARDVQDFILTAELSRHPRAYTNKRLAHLTVYYKLMARREQVPSIKDRIPYVIVAQTREVEETVASLASIREQDEGPSLPLAPPEPPTKKPRRPGESSSRPRKLLISELAEDPGYVLAHNVPLNTDYYFSHLLGAACVTFKALFGNNAKITEHLLKRFIPEMWHPTEEIAAQLRLAGFVAVGAGATEEEIRQRLHRAFDTLTSGLRRS